MLEIRNLHAKAGDKDILRGLDLGCVRARSTRSWGRTAPARAPSPTCSRAVPATPSPRGRSSTRAATSSRCPPRSGRGRASSSRSSIRWRSPGVSNVYFLKAASNAIRKHRGQPELDAIDFLDLVKEKAGARGDRRGPREAARERGLLRRGEEAERDLPDGGARARRSPSSTRPTPASTSTRCASSPPG